MTRSARLPLCASTAVSMDIVLIPIYAHEGRGYNPFFTPCNVILPGQCQDLILYTEQLSSV